MSEPTRTDGRQFDAEERLKQLGEELRNVADRGADSLQDVASCLEDIADRLNQVVTLLERLADTQPIVDAIKEINQLPTGGNATTTTGH